MIFKIFIIILVLFIIIIQKKNIDIKEKFSNREKINLVISCDQNQFIGLIAVVNSILIHTKSENRLHFYFLVNKNEKLILNKLINKYFKINYFIKEIYDDKILLNNIKVNIDNNIKNIMNFSRFNFHINFPNLDKILYIDADMIVKAPIEYLYDTCDINKYPFYAVSFKNIKLSDDIYKEGIKKFNLDINENYFNAGLYITSLNYWKQNNIKKNIIYIMKEHKKFKKGYFKLGTQPILNIAFHKKFKTIDKRWNSTNLGYKNNLKKKYLDNAYVLHWTGKKKPWSKDGLYKDYWNEYNLIK